MRQYWGGGGGGKGQRFTDEGMRRGDAPDAIEDLQILKGPVCCARKCCAGALDACAARQRPGRRPHADTHRVQKACGAAVSSGELTAADGKDCRQY